MAYMAGLFLHDFPPKDIAISSFSDIFRVSPFLEVPHDLTILDPYPLETRGSDGCSQVAARDILTALKKGADCSWSSIWGAICRLQTHRHICVVGFQRCRVQGHIVSS